MRETHGIEQRLLRTWTRTVLRFNPHLLAVKPLLLLGGKQDTYEGEGAPVACLYGPATAIRGGPHRPPR
jgi:hypothetical protein